MISGGIARSSAYTLMENVGRASEGQKGKEQAQRLFLSVEPLSGGQQFLGPLYLGWAVLWLSPGIP